MLTLSVIKENPEEVIRRLAIKHFDGKEAINRVLELDKIRRASQAELDGKLAELKVLAAQTGQLMKAGKKEEAEAVKMKTATIKESTKELEESMVSAEKEITDILLTVPNLPYAGVPEGRTAEDNIVEKTGGAAHVPQVLYYWRVHAGSTSRRCASALGFGQEIRFNRFRVGCEDYRCRIPCV
jgi:seryl-tRNA synthetase